MLDTRGRTSGQASTALSRNNHNLQPLHPNARDSRAMARTKTATGRSTDSAASPDQANIVKTLQMTEDELYAAPHDSSDEEDVDQEELDLRETPLPALGPRVKQMTSVDKIKETQRKSTRTTAKSQSRTRHLQDNADIVPRPNSFELDETKQDRFMASQMASSQASKRRKFDYSARNRKDNIRNDNNTITSDPRAAAGSTNLLFLVPDSISKSPPTKNNMRYDVPGSLSPAARRKTRSENTTVPKSLTSPTALRPKPIPKGFVIPDMDEIIALSTSSSEPSALFSASGSPISRRRRSSTSSLSSADSIHSMMMEDDEKARLGGDESTQQLPANKIRCPVCNNLVDLSFYETFETGRKRNIRAQQRFCNAHKKVDADSSWALRGFPKVDWKASTTSRLEKHRKLLHNILNGSQPSYYCSELEKRMEEANRSKSKRSGNHLKFLKNDLMDVAAPGYYGPKGSKLISQAISRLMRDEIQHQTQEDSTARIVGFAAYVNAVLTPEVIARYVMEDMNLVSEDEARQVITDSTDIGASMCEDEDDTLLIVND